MPAPFFYPPTNRNATTNASARGGGRARRSTSLLGTEMPGVLFSLGIEKTDKFKPTTSRPHALHLQFYSSVSVWRGTEGGGVDAHRNRHLEEDYLTPGKKREGAYECCLDLIALQNKSEIAKLRRRRQAFARPLVGPPHSPLFWESPVGSVKSSQGLLFSEAKKPYAEAVGPTGAQGLVRGYGPHCPPVSRKNPARDEAS